jgi:predicted NBD/HSP70 family sugar kinase
MSVYIGLDIGGTKFVAAAADENGNILSRDRQPTPLELDEGLSLLHEMIGRVAGEEEIAAIGAAIGGPMDWKTGVVSPLHQPGWREVPLKAIMEEKWGCPFHVDVDTNVAALGEYRFGGEAASRLLYITMSTGMGGGFLVDGEVYRGAGGAHPEIAHQSISFRCSNPDGISCECGLPDCLEALVSGNGIRRIYHKPAEHLGDEEWGEVAYNVGQGLRNLATIYAPDVIVLGGGVALGGGERLVDGACEVMETHLKLVPPPQVRLSRLGHDTPLMGAIAFAMQGVEPCTSAND